VGVVFGSVARRTHAHAPLRGDPAKGAALSAPTAPHATPPLTKAKPTGPSRFWDRRRIRVALSITLVVSAVAHWFVAPWNLLPPSTGIEFKDPEGDLSIPVDLLGEETPPPPPPPAAQEPTPPGNDPTAPGRPDAGPKPRIDAGPAEGMDASANADLLDGGPSDAASDAEPIAMTDAGGGPPGSNGPRDPETMFGMKKAVNTGIQNVVLGVNVTLVRKHPVGSRMGPILQAIPQWRDFLRGAQAPVDPIRDTDWILIYGPSLIHTDRDAVLVRYNVSDEAVDTTIHAIAKSYDKGGSYDAGVRGVPASLGFADNAQRVFLRPQSKLLVIVPPANAHEAAVTYRTQAPRGPSATEAVRLVVRRPSNQISIPGLKFSESLKEIRLWVVPKSDGSADVFAEGDCTDEAAAIDSADRLNDVLRRLNSLGVKFATRGLLNKAVVEAHGTQIRLHVDVTPEQLEAVLQLVAASLNAQVPPPAGAAPRPSQE
jgi:hypothetical protein